MFETTFTYKSSTPLPPSISLSDALSVLHDFETVNRLNPDVHGCRPIVPKNGYSKSQPPANGTANGSTLLDQVQYFEVEDDLPFIPKKLWSGGVKYQADFVPLVQGCDITIHAPGGFTSVNHWRLVLDESRTDALNEEQIHRRSTEQQFGQDLQPVKSKDLMHPESDAGAWYVQIVSDARCNRTFAGFVRGFLKNSHTQLQRAFIDTVKSMSLPLPESGGKRRPTLGRRRSSAF